ncbi:MAG TPA: DUF4876 domain-containing protein [Niabella sp.]|nr:DUF4876 domain-containing protein [Niabella sp.]
MKKSTFRSFLFIILAGLLIISCKKNDDAFPQSNASVSLVNPGNLESVQILDGTITFTEINTNSVVTSSAISNGKINITIPQGSYNVTFEGNIQYQLDGSTAQSKVRAYKDGLVITSTTSALDLPLFLYNETAGFVIQEIFFTGTVTPESKTYNGDKYVIIYNNSDKVLYADSLVFAESHFLTTTKRAYTPDIMNEAFTSSTLVMVPGDGNDYPIQPGESFVIANNAINHKEYNTNSFDLSKSKFEIELLSSINVDNPEVPNTVNLAGFLTMHNRGFKSYVIFKMNKSVADFKTQNAYTTTYINAVGNPTNAQVYKVENSSIIDAVNLSVASEYEWIVTSPSLDMGWTYCGKVDSDANRYGKSVIRKILSTTPDGRKIYKDTNNSTVDFDPEQKASLSN